MLLNLQTSQPWMTARHNGFGIHDISGLIDTRHIHNTLQLRLTGRESETKTKPCKHVSYTQVLGSPAETDAMGKARCQNCETRWNSDHDRSFGSEKLIHNRRRWEPKNTQNTYRFDEDLIPILNQCACGVCSFVATLNLVILRASSTSVCVWNHVESCGRMLAGKLYIVVLFEMILWKIDIR